MQGSCMGWDIHLETTHHLGHSSRHHTWDGTCIPRAICGLGCAPRTLQGGRCPVPVPGTPWHRRVSNPSQSVFFAGDEGV